MNDAQRITLYHKVPCDAHDVMMMVVAKMIILLTFIYMVCVYPVNVYKYNGVNGTTKTGHRQLSMKQ